MIENDSNSRPLVPPVERKRPPHPSERAQRQELMAHVESVLAGGEADVETLEDLIDEVEQQMLGLSDMVAAIRPNLEAMRNQNPVLFDHLIEDEAASAPGAQDAFEQTVQAAQAPLRAEIREISTILDKLKNKLKEVRGWDLDDVREYVERLKAQDGQEDMARALDAILRHIEAGVLGGGEQPRAGRRAESSPARPDDDVLARLDDDVLASSDDEESEQEVWFPKAAQRPRGLWGNFIRRVRIEANKNKEAMALLLNENRPLLTRLERSLEKKVKTFLQEQRIDLRLLDRILEEHKSFKKLSELERESIVPLLLVGQAEGWLTLSPDILQDPDFRKLAKKLDPVAIKLSSPPADLIRTRIGESEEKTVPIKRSLVSIWLKLQKSQLRRLPYVMENPYKEEWKEQAQKEREDRERQLFDQWLPDDDTDEIFEPQQDKSRLGRLQQWVPWLQRRRRSSKRNEQPGVSAPDFDEFEFGGDEVNRNDESDEFVFEPEDDGDDDTQRMRSVRGRGAASAETNAETVQLREVIIDKLRKLVAEVMSSLDKNQEVTQEKWSTTKDRLYLLLDEDPALGSLKRVDQAITEELVRELLVVYYQGDQDAADLVKRLGLIEGDEKREIDDLTTPDLERERARQEVEAALKQEGFSAEKSSNGITPDRMRMEFKSAIEDADTTFFDIVDVLTDYAFPLLEKGTADDIQLISQALTKLREMKP